METLIKIELEQRLKGGDRGAERMAKRRIFQAQAKAQRQRASAIRSQGRVVADEVKVVRESDHLRP